MRLIILLLFIHNVNCVIHHHCAPYIKEDKDQKPYINVTVNRLTSLLIYEIGDIQHTNIPLHPHGEGIKQYDFNFTLCGLQDLDSGLCSKEEFGLFTILKPEHMRQPYFNKFLDVGTTTIYEIPYSGVWCSLTYQDDDWMIGYFIHFVQFFGFLTVEEYNHFQTLSVVILINMAVLIYWIFKTILIKKSSRDQKPNINKSIWISLVSSLIYYIFIRTYLCLISFDDGYNEDLKLYEIASLIMASIAIFPIYYSLFGLSNNDQSSHDMKSTNTQFSTKIFIVILLLKVWFEYLYRSYRTESFGFFKTVSSLITWGLIYKRLLQSSTSRNIKRLLFIVPFALLFIKYIIHKISWYISYWDLYRTVENIITDKNLLVMEFESQVNISLIHSIMTNIEQFEYIVIVLGLVVLY